MTISHLPKCVKALAASDLGSVIAADARYRPLLRQHPGIAQVVCTATDWLLDAIPAPDASTSLLSHALARGYQGYQASLAKAERERTRAPQIAFLNAFLADMAAVNHVTVGIIVGNGQATWDQSEPLCRFKLRYSNIPLRIHAIRCFDLDDVTARRYMAARLVPPALLAHLAIGFDALV